MTQEKIIEILAERLESDPSEISAETEFAALGLDSLDMTELLMDLEDAFGIEMEPDPALKTVADVAARVEELKKA